MAKKKDHPELPPEREEAGRAESNDIAGVTDLVTSGQLSDAELSEDRVNEAMTDTNPVMAAEEAAVNADTTSAKAASGDPTAAVEEAPKPPKVGKARHRSARYLEVAATIEPGKRYNLDTAIGLAKQGSYAKFDGTLSIQVRVAPKKGKGESDSIRGLLQLPHGSGKQVSAVILTEEMIEKIASTGKVTHDILIATPALMPKVAKVAKILGPQGKMPSPKAGTVSDDPESIMKALTSGRVEYRADKSGIIAQPIGKVSWDDAKLAENAKAVIGALTGYQLLSVTLAATMGPGVRVDTSEFSK